MCCDDVESLNLDSNLCSGTLPTELGSVLNFVDLRLGSNFFSGPVPSEIGLLANLTNLELQFNPDLTGTIPAEIQNLPNLKLNTSGTQIDASE